MKRTLTALLLLSALLLCACGRVDGAPETAAPVIETEEPVMETKLPETAAARLLYLGHGSVRIVTPEEKVIYIDPYAPGDYSLPADLILVTHDHFDHCKYDCIESRQPDCTVITQVEALAGGEHHSFELPYVTVQAVEAGNNKNHSIQSCVGYVLTLSDGVKVYLSGDTSETAQMAEMADMAIDYAFFCCDGVYNMDDAEAARCAALVGAKHNIPYHNHPAGRDGKYFDAEKAARFPADNLLVILPGEEIELQK